jgi:rubrerythrin
MLLKTEFTHWLRVFLGIGDEARRTVLDILRQRYLDETEHAEKFRQHAEKMHYPQFRKELLNIAAQEGEHTQWVAKELVALGDRLPEARKIHLTEENSWKHLLKDLEEESRCSGELMEQIRTVQSDYPDIAALLQRISEDEKKHCDEIREMLMRSDAFAGSLA